jgi:hypothetical protein
MEVGHRDVAWMLGEFPSLLRMIPRHPVVPDANAIAEDVVHYANRELATGVGFSRLTLLAGLGVAHAFVPEHIPGKVELWLEKVARDCKVDIALAYGTWGRVHRPLLHVVELPEITAADDPRVVAVLVADPEDAPVAQLAVLLAPALLLTKDHHLLDAGLGVARWADALGIVKQVVEMDGATQAGLRMASAGSLSTARPCGVRRVRSRSLLC